MGFLGKIGHGLAKVGGAVGDVAKKAAPLATFIPGVGPGVAGVIGIGGGLLGKLNDEDKSLGSVLKDAALYGAGGYGGAKALDKFAPGKLGEWANKPKGGYLPAEPGDISGALNGAVPGGRGSILGVGGQNVGAGGVSWQDPSTLKHIAVGGGSGGGLGGVIGGVGDWIGDNPLKALSLATGLAGVYQNAQAQGQNRQMTEEQLANARAAIARQKELQDRALQPINVATPDYTSIFSQTQNPFYQRGS